MEKKNEVFCSPQVDKLECEGLPIQDFEIGKHGVANQTTAKKFFDLAKLHQTKTVFVAGHGQWLLDFLKVTKVQAEPEEKRRSKGVLKEKLKEGEIVRLDLIDTRHGIKIKQARVVLPGFPDA